ncbi:MAG TPA: hypothetical protein VGD62_06610 [Acidobacteriaceae bacterium]
MPIAFLLPSRPLSVAAATLVLAACALPLQGQKQPQHPAPPPPRDAPRATVIRPTPLYIQGDTSSSKLGTVTPGREVVILERSAHWLRVYANTDIETVREQDVPAFSNEQAEPPLSGWVEDRGIVAGDTPQGDNILFGEAISTEQAAAEPHAAPGTAEDARRLYRMLAIVFPQSPRAPEAMWRSADIRWQLQHADAATLPSAHEKESYLREQPDDSEMKKIEKLFPGSKWADFAAYEMLDTRMCGDWQGSEKCPEKEAGYYAKYAEEHAQSPRAAESLYKAAWRLACAGDMWIADNDEKRAAADRSAAGEMASRLLAKYPQSDYAARAAGLVYKVQQHISIYGNDRE